MKPITTFLTNRVMKAPKNWNEKQHGVCEPLPVVKEDGAFYSYWKPSFKERLKILFGRPIRLCVFSQAMPPVAVEVATGEELK